VTRRRVPTTLWKVCIRCHKDASKSHGTHHKAERWFSVQPHAANFKTLQWPPVYDLWPDVKPPAFEGRTRHTGKKPPNIHLIRCSRCIHCISDQVMSDRKNDEWKIGKDLQRSGRGVIEAPSRNLPGNNEENHVKHQDSRCFDRYYIRHPSECAQLDTVDQTNTCATAWNLWSRRKSRKTSGQPVFRPILHPASLWMRPTRHVWPHTCATAWSFGSMKKIK